MWLGISPSTVFSELPSKEGGFGILVIVVWMGFCIFIWSMKMVIYYELAMAREKAPIYIYVQKKCLDGTHLDNITKYHSRYSFSNKYSLRETAG